MPMFLFYSASPEKQHNIPAFYSSGNSKTTLCAPWPGKLASYLATQTELMVFATGIGML